MKSRIFYVYVDSADEEISRVFYVGKGLIGRVKNTNRRNRLWYKIRNKYGLK